MKLLDKKTTADAVKLGIFIVVTSLATALLAITIGNFSFGSTKTYRAVFSDATGLVGGDDIRIAGVRVGSVTGIDIYHRNEALVTFTVQSQTALTESTLAAIRYRNLVGQRYISLRQGDGSGQVLQAGATIPLDRTSPALDLTVLFNGFKPLFRALTPSDVNKLAYEIIQVFQGEGGTLKNLLARTASVTNTLANRDQLIGDLITNLNETLGTVANRDQQFNDLIVSLRSFISGLSQDRKAILGSLDSISQLAVQTADLVTGIRPGLTKDISGLRKVAHNINAQGAEVDRALKVLPIKLTKVGRTAIYGSWFNFYLCSFKGHVIIGGTSAPLEYNTGDARCNLS